MVGTGGEVIGAGSELITAGENLVEGGAELVNRVYYIVKGAELSGVEIGEEFVGGEGVGIV